MRGNPNSIHPDINPYRLVPESVDPTPGAALLKHGYPAIALPYLEKEKEPASLINRAIALRWLNRLTEAKDIIKEAIRLHPDLPDAWNTAGTLHDDFGEWEAAEGCYAVAYSQAHHPQYSLNLACSLMRQGKLEQAWEYWERGRFGVSWYPPHPGLPPWGGQLPAKVICCTEGGYGDLFLFSRFLYQHLLPANVKLETWAWDKVYDLNLWQGLKVHSHKHQLDLSDFTHSTSILSLMAVAKMKSISSIPKPQPIPQFRVLSDAKWGICWGAEENGVRRRLRSLSVKDIEPLRGVGPGWVSLFPNSPEPVPDWIEQVSIPTWRDTIANLRRLSLVVSADTAVAHLSALLGIPTYILLPVHSDWKWFTHDLTGCGSPWWPTASLVRNTDPIGWEPAITELVKRLNAQA